MPSESSSPEHRDHCFDHGPSELTTTRKCCLCGALPEEPEAPKAPNPSDRCACGHQHRNHTSSRCCACDALAIKGFMHAFRLSVEPPETPIVDVELPEPEAPSPGDRCTCKHKRKKHFEGGCLKCYKAHRDTYEHVFELDTGQGWPCGDCGATVPGDLDWCPSCPAKVPPVGEDLSALCVRCFHTLGRHVDAGPMGPAHCGACLPGGDRDVHLHEFILDRGPVPPRPSAGETFRMLRRSPYAVAYAIEGGHLYEIALPGDASVIAEDGILKISHPGAVLALVQARPMEVPDAVDAEKQDAREVRVE